MNKENQNGSWLTLTIRTVFSFYVWLDIFG